MILTILFSVIFAQLAFAAEEKLPDVQNTEQNTEEDFILPNIFILPDPADLYETDTTSENKVEDNILYEQETFPVRYDDSSVARYDLSQDWDEVIELSDIQDKKFKEAIDNMKFNVEGLRKLLHNKSPELERHLSSSLIQNNKVTLKKDNL